MQTNWQIGSLFGIPLFLDPLWFVILGLTTLNFGLAYQQWGTVAGWGCWFNYGTAVICFRTAA